MANGVFKRMHPARKIPPTRQIATGYIPRALAALLVFVGVSCSASAQSPLGEPICQPLPPVQQAANYDNQRPRQAAYQAAARPSESQLLPPELLPPAPPVAPPPAIGAMNLRQAEGLALQYNPILLRAAARIAAARGDALQAGLYPNPRFDTNNPQVFSGTSTSLNAGFQQEIVVKGKLRLDKAAATEVVRQREIGLTLDRIAMLTNVRQQFYTVLSDQRRVEVLGEVRDVAIAALRAAQGRVQAGEGTLPEVLLLQTELQRVESSLRNAQTDLEADRRQLTAIIGRPDITVPGVSGELTAGFPEFNRDDVRQFVVSQNAQVLIARRDIDRNQILAKRARVEVFPNLTMGQRMSTRCRRPLAARRFGST